MNNRHTYRAVVEITSMLLKAILQKYNDIGQEWFCIFSLMYKIRFFIYTSNLMGIDIFLESGNNFTELSSHRSLKGNN